MQKGLALLQACNEGNVSPQGDIAEVTRAAAPVLRALARNLLFEIMVKISTPSYFAHVKLNTVIWRGILPFAQIELLPCAIHSTTSPWLGLGLRWQAHVALAAAPVLSTHAVIVASSKLGRIITPCSDIMAQTSMQSLPLQNVLGAAGTVRMVVWPRPAAACQQTQTQAIPLMGTSQQCNCCDISPSKCVRSKSWLAARSEDWRSHKPALSNSCRT
jgi:hypothetical protein